MRSVRTLSAFRLPLLVAVVGVAGPACDEGKRDIPSAEPGEGEGEGEDPGPGDGGGGGGGQGQEDEGEDRPVDLCADVDCSARGGVCRPATGRCVNADPCGDDSECITGFICNAMRLCVEDLCEGFACDKGVCNPEIEDPALRCVEPAVCTDDTQCLQPGWICGDDGACAPPCWALDEGGEVLKACADDLICDAGGHCLSDPAACDADNPCPTSDLRARVCVEGACQDSCTLIGCTRGRCDAQTGLCVQPEICVGSRECFGDLVCIDGACVPPAEDPRRQCDAAECPAPQTCNEFGDCADPEQCELDADCATGICNEDAGACVACQFDEDCPGNQTCLGGLTCVEPDRCVDDQDCAGQRVCVDARCRAGECAPDRFEPDGGAEGPAGAAEIGAGLFNGLTICGADEDWYRVFVPAGSGLRAAIRFDPADGDLDLAVFQAPDTERPVDTSAQFGTPTETAVLALAEEDTWAFINVYAPGVDDISATYSLSVTLVDGLACEDDALDEALIGDSMDNPAGFGVGAIFEGTICAGDADWFATQLEDGETLVADVAFDADLGGLVVNIIDDSGASVALAAPNEAGTAVRAAFTSNGGGVYWISVAGADPASVNKYELSASKFRQAGLDECGSPIRLEVGVPYEGNTEDRGADHLSTCGGGGDGAPDAVHSFTLHKPSIVTITVEADGWDAIAVLRSACDAVGAEIACADDPEVITALLDPGTYFVIVDAWNRGDGAYTITWEIEDPVCVPGDRGCIGNLAAICVDDGSGYEPLGHCAGLCDAEAGTCESDNDTCGSPTVLVDGETVRGSTVGVADDYDTGCSDAAATTGDVVYQWQQADRGGVRVEFASDTPFLSWSLRTACRGPDSEFFCNYAIGGEGLFILDPGAYFVIVDGQGVEGEFDLTVSRFEEGCDFFRDNHRCSPDAPDMLQACDVDRNRESITYWRDDHECEQGCADGHCNIGNDRCQDAEELLPGAVLSGDTRGAHNDANPTCDERSVGGEVFYSFTLAERMGVELRIEDADYSALVHVRTDCDAQASERICAPPITFLGFVFGWPEWTGVLDAGTYYVAVDGVADTEGQFGLFFDTFVPECDPADPAVCDGDVLLACSEDGREITELVCPNGCDAASGHCTVPNDACAGAQVLVPGEPVEATVGGAGNDYQSVGCPFGGGNGPDHVYTFTVEAEQVATVTLDATSGADFILYMRRGRCDQAFLETDCLDDNVETPDMPRPVGERLQRVVGAGTYYVFVDAWGGLPPGNPGDYRLLLELQAAICDAEELRCSDDATGIEACIGAVEWVRVADCADGCLDGECVAEEGGDCAEPRPIDELGVAYEGNTGGFAVEEGSSCGGGPAPEVVYSYEVAEASLVSISLEGSDYDTVLWVRTGCDDAATEVACNDDMFGLQSGVAVPVEAGTTLFIFVSGFADRAGNYQLTVDSTPLLCWPGDRTCGEGEQDGWLLECAGDGSEWLPVVQCPLGCDSEIAECAVPNDRCGDDSRLIEAGQAIEDTTEFAANDYNGTCALGNAGDNTFTFTLNDGIAEVDSDFGVDIQLLADFDGYFYVRRDCADRASEVACTAGGFGFAAHRGVLPEGTYYIIVDGQGFFGGNEGAYTLSFDTFRPVCRPAATVCDGSILRTCVDDGMAWRSFECPGACEVGANGAAGCVVENDSCDNPTVLRPRQWVSGDTRAAADDYDPSCVERSGADTVHAFDVPAPADADDLGFGARFWFQWAEGELPPVMSIRRECRRAISEVDGSCGLPTNQFLEPIPVEVPLPAGGRHYLLVDAAPEFGIVEGEYAVRWEPYALECEPGATWCDEAANTFNACNLAGTEVATDDCAPGFCGEAGCVLPGDTCDLPQVLEVPALDADGVSVAFAVGDTRGFANDYQPTCGFSNGADVVYELAVPEGALTAAVDVRAPADGGFDTFVAVYSSPCADQNEIGCNDDYEGTRRSYVAGIDVAGGGSIYVVVTGFERAAGPYDLEVTFRGAPPPPPDPCDALIDLVPGEPAAGDTTLSAESMGSICDDVIDGPDDLYGFTLERDAWVTVDLGVESVEQCAETCGPGMAGEWAGDGWCDEGWFCPAGTDCADCGPAVLPPWNAVVEVAAGQCPDRAALYCPQEVGSQVFDQVLPAGAYTVLVTGAGQALGAPAAGAYTLGLTVVEGDCFDEFARSCDGAVARACDVATFTWVDEQECANGCADGFCVLECEPVGATMCDGDLLLTCDDANEWDQGEPCLHGCEAGACLPECFPGGIRECRGDVPRVCDPDTLTWVAGDACANGCVNGACRPDNDRCGDGVVALESGGAYEGSTVGASNDTSGSCAFGNAPENFYAFNVPDDAHDGVQVALAADFNAFFYVQGACGDRASEVACEAPADLGGQAVLPARGEDLDGAGANGACEEAEVTDIQIGGTSGRVATWFGSTVGAAGDDTSAGCTSGNAADVAMAFTVDSLAEADFYMEGDYDTVLYLLAGGCGEDAAIACSDDLFGIGTSGFEGVRLEPGVTYYLVADGWFETGDFLIQADIRNLDVPDTRYLRLEPGDYTLVVDGWGANAAGRRGDYTLWFDLFDSVCVPGATWCDIEGNVRQCDATGAQEADPVACPYGCEADEAAGTASCAAAPNDMCVDAASVEGGAAEWGDSRFAPNDFEPPVDAFCGGRGRDLWYTFSLDGCADVEVVVTPDVDSADPDTALAAESYDASVFLLTGCLDGPVPGEYLACADDGGGGRAETVGGRLDAGDYTVVVDGWGELDAGPFLIEVLATPCGEGNP